MVVRLALLLALALAACTVTGPIMPSDTALPERESTRGCFLAPEWLSNPTPDGLTISVIPAQATDLYVEYGPPEQDLASRTPTITVGPEQLAAIRLSGLPPDTEYAYRVRHRASSGKDTEGTPFLARDTHRFRTLRSPGPATFSFGFATDSHAYGQWARATCAGRTRWLRTLEHTLENIARDDLDFLILGGDEVINLGSKAPFCQVDGEDAGGIEAMTGRHAELRYRVFRRVFSKVAHSVPVFLTLGNHEGELGFCIPGSACERHGSLTETYEQARLAALPNPATVYPGGENGNYFAFASGSALFVILDVMRYTNVVPRSPEDWTLGKEQMHWLEETLLQSRHRWKLVFAHHLVGGMPLRPNYSYGRGGIRSTVDGKPSSPFLGEQRLIHELMKRAGAQFFIYGHDHLFAFAAKEDALGRPDGVFYLCGGSSIGDVSGWADHQWVRRAYGVDENDRPAVIDEPGYVRVTVHGEREVTIRYIVTDIDDPQRNSKVLFERTVN
jgi:hypothetical protein